MLLLNPGPVTLSERVRRAMLKPDICHREPEFADMQEWIRGRLLDVYGLKHDTWAAVLISGSGTCAVEAMVASLVPRDGHLLSIENGVYGERISRIAGLHNMDCVPLHFDWGAEICLRRLEKSLAARKDITHVAVVHHETTTGRLNDLRRIGEVCRKHGAGLLSDAVSSFAGEEMDFEKMGIAACAATANKCLHGVPGLAFVVCRRDALAAACNPPRTLYLDLPLYCSRQDERDTPFTPAVQCFYALQEALQEFDEQGGWKARHARYLKLAESVRAGLSELGIEPYISADQSSVVLRSYRLPPGMTYETLHDGLKRAGFVIYAGQNKLKQRVFRISTMGEMDEKDIAGLLEAFRKIVTA